MSYPKWVLKYKRKGAAIHKIGNRYYLYEITSVWDKEKKRARKVTKRYLGVITKEGITEPAYKRKIPTTVKEYGASMYLIKENQEIVEGLKEFFPSQWKELFVLSCLRLMHKSPLKNMGLYYQDSWFSEEIKEVSFYPQDIQRLLKRIGSDRGRIGEFLRDLMEEKEGVLIDLTHVFSLSENMILSAKGYNSEFDFTPQINVLFLFSPKKKMPLFYRVLPGNVRDVKSLKTTIEESRIKEVIVIADKGFYSKENVQLLEKDGISYILPLKRNNFLIDYGVLEKGDRKKFEGYFQFKKRFIWYYRSGKDLPVWVYLDERLRVKEQEDYLSRIQTHPEFGYTVEGFHRNQARFGSIALITNLKQLSAKRVFEYFKSRVEIEIMFDAFKNILQADRTYMRSDHSMETWMFLNFLALIYYYKIYHLLITHDLLSKYSPADFLLHLSRIRKVKISSQWIDLEIPKQSRTLLEKTNLPIT